MQTNSPPVPDAPTDECDGTMVEPSVVHDEETCVMALVDELAVLAADVWFAGKPAPCAPEEEAAEEGG